jgi:hypothetical protein
MPWSPAPGSPLYNVGGYKPDINWTNKPARRPPGFKETGVTQAQETAIRRKNARLAAGKKAAAAAKPKPKPKPKPVVPSGGSLANTGPSPDVAALMGLDPNAMASAEFGPQYELLNRLRSQAESRYGGAARDVSGMYAQLADEFRRQEAGIKGQYGAAGKAYAGQLGSANKALQANFAQSRDEIAKRAARMGTTEGLGQLSAESAGQQNQYSGLLSAIAQNYQGLNTAEQQSSVNYNRDTAATTDLMGADARQNIMGALQSALDEYGNKELELRGSEGAARNKYGLSVAEMLQEAQQNAQSNALNQARLASEQELGRGKLELGAAELEQRTQEARNKALAPVKGPDFKNLPPDQALAAMAAQLYPNVGDSTRRAAIDAILHTFSRGAEGMDRQWNNVSEFMADVQRRNPNARDYSQLEALARLFYEKMAGGYNKPYG